MITRSGKIKPSNTEPSTSKKSRKKKVREVVSPVKTDHSESEPEIEQLEMGDVDPDDRPMWSADSPAPPLALPSVMRPAIDVENWEIKGQFFHLLKDIQFDGRSSSNPNEHLENFEELCDMYQNRGLTEDQLKLRTFPFSLTGDAKSWLKSLPSGSITTWALLRTKFLNRYFPQVKADKARMDIHAFTQQSGESLGDAWERLKKMLRNCPGHGISKKEQVHIFYRGTDETTRGVLDASASGVFMGQSPNNAFRMLDNMAVHTYEWGGSRDRQVRRVARAEDDENGETIASLSNQFKSFRNEMKKMNERMTAMAIGCDLCGGGHLAKDCDDRPMMTPEEQVHFLGYQKQDAGGGFQGGNRNFQQGNNSGAGNYQNRNFGYQNSGYQRNGAQGFQNRNQNYQSNFQPQNFQNSQQNYQQPPPQPQNIYQPPLLTQPEKKQSTEEVIASFMQRFSECEERMNQQFRSQQAAIQAMERNLNNLSQQQAGRTPGSLPSNTTENPKSKDNQKAFASVNTIVEDEWKIPDDFVFTGYADYTPYKVKDSTSSEENFEDESEGSEEVYGGDDVIIVRNELHRGSKLEAFRNPGIRSPFHEPQAEIQTENLKKVESSVAVDGGDERSSAPREYKSVRPLEELLAGFPGFGKFLEEQLGGGPFKLRDAINSFLELEVDNILKRKDLPPKRGDPGPLIIPCHLNGLGNYGALVDSGACINLIPFSLYERLELGDLKPCIAGIKSFNKVVSRPRGSANNVVVRVGELRFLTDFVVVDIEEDREVPIILGRPFLSTAGALIDVRASKITVRDRGKQWSYLSTRVATDPTSSQEIGEMKSLTIGTGRPPKCGEGDSNFPDRPSTENTLDRSMRKLRNRVHNCTTEMDDQLRNRLTSNLSMDEEAKLISLVYESKRADNWLLKRLGYGDGRGPLQMKMVPTDPDWGNG